MKGRPPAVIDRVPDLDDRIVYEADGLLVVDKPAGLATAGRTLEDPDCLQAALITRRRGRMVWAVHQLDADTSGVNIFVTRRSLVPEYQRRMRFPRGRKRYIAICHGEPDFDRRRVDAPIGFVAVGDRRGQAVTSDGKPAATRLEVLARGGGFTVVRATLESGRTHQIRVHLAHLGHPLIGEPWYRKPPCERHERHALHALEIVFSDDREPAGFSAPIPPDLAELAAELGLPDLYSIVRGASASNVS